MTTTYNKLGFALTGLRTVSFAIIEKAYKKSGETFLITGLGFGVDIEDHTASCKARFSFEKKKDQPFLVLEVQALFEIEKDDFINKIKQSNNTYVITKGLATHFAVLAIGSARGILHVKTENTAYNEYLLPTIDVIQMIPEDLVFKI